MQHKQEPIEIKCPHRRDFLRAGSLSLLGMGLSQYFGMAKAQTTPGKAQACILLLLEGGPSHMDTWDPKPLSGFKPIPTNVPGIQISEAFRALPSAWISSPLFARSIQRSATIRRAPSSF